jgi:hypothetical protein
MVDPRTAAHKAAEAATRGYVISEDNDLALKDLSLALYAVGEIIEQGGDLPELPEANWGALFRTFARQAEAIHTDALFANQAMARPRGVH